MVEGDDGGVFRDGPVGQLLLDQLPVLVLVPRVCRFEAPLKVLQVRRNAKNKEFLIPANDGVRLPGLPSVF